MPRVNLEQIPVTIPFSMESHGRKGWVSFEEVTGFSGHDVIAISQRLERTEQWEDDAIRTVYVPRALLKSLFASQVRDNRKEGCKCLPNAHDAECQYHIHHWVTNNYDAYGLPYAHWCNVRNCHMQKGDRSPS